MIRVLPPSFASTSEAIRQIGERVNLLMRGRSNASGEVTLTDSSTTTVVSDVNVSEDSQVMLTAKTTDAATESIHVSAVANGSFTLTHSNAVTARTFGYHVIG